MTVEQALQTLRDGNRRFVENDLHRPHTDADTRRRTASEGQHPFACVLTCSDSRVPLHHLFDSGIGDLFEVQVAGNVCGEMEAASVDFAVLELAVPVMLVLGHTHCGAVTAAVQELTTTGPLKQLLDRVRPSAMQARREVTGGSDADTIHRATELNVEKTMEDLLLGSGRVRAAVRDGQMALVGAIYDIDSGEVSQFRPHPRQAEWLDLD